MVATLMSPVGGGAYGQVYVASVVVKSQSRDFAAKLFTSGEDEFMREAKCMAGLINKHIVELHAVSVKVAASNANRFSTSCWRRSR